jgi:hypothetical protein
MTRHWCIKIYGSEILYGVAILDTPVENLHPRQELNTDV